jgi:hypothetical protein
MPTFGTLDIVRDLDGERLLPVDIADAENAEYIAAVFVFEKSGRVRVNKVVYDKAAEQGRQFCIHLSETYGRPGKVLGERKCPLSLDKTGGDVMSGGEYVCTLNINTLPYRYLAILIDSFPAARTYKEIAYQLKADGATIDRKVEDPIGAQNFCFEMKRRIRTISPALAGYIRHAKGMARISA